MCSESQPRLSLIWGAEFRGHFLIPAAMRMMPAPGLVGSGNSLSPLHPQSCQTPPRSLPEPLTLPENVQRPRRNAGCQAHSPFLPSWEQEPLACFRRGGTCVSLCGPGQFGPPSPFQMPRVLGSRKAFHSLHHGWTGRRGRSGSVFWSSVLCLCAMAAILLP